MRIHHERIPGTHSLHPEIPHNATHTNVSGMCSASRRSVPVGEPCTTTVRTWPNNSPSKGNTTELLPVSSSVPLGVISRVRQTGGHTRMNILRNSPDMVVVHAASNQTLTLRQINLVPASRGRDTSGRNIATRKL